MELLVGALKKSPVCKERPFVLAREGHMHRRRMRRLAECDQPACQCLADARCINAVTHQQARPGGWRERHAGLQFRIVTAARARVGFGPAVVEDVFTLRMIFQIARHDADGLASHSRHEMTRPPSGARDG